MRIIAIIQARIGSTRLPGKVLKELIGEPMLIHVHNRVSRSTLIDDVIIATTDQRQDDIIAELCREEKWLWYRGSENDVLDRYYQAAKNFKGDIITRITSDCPIIDPSIIDKVLQKFTELHPSLDYVSNIFPERTFPQGLDTEAIRFRALERAWKDDNNPALREHVTQYILKNPLKFKILNITNPLDLSFHRWTVDTPEDFSLIQNIYEHFGHNRFTWIEVLEYLEKNPCLMEINKHIRQKVV